MEKHPKAPANNKRLYGQNAAVALKYNPDMNYAPVVVASGTWRTGSEDRSTLRTRRAYRSTGTTA